MNIRQMKPEDLNTVMNLYSAARVFMKENGNPSQWKDDWPPRSYLEYDIEQQRAYVVCDDSDQTLCAFVYWFDDHAEPTYDEIEGTGWRKNQPYAVIHRIASVPQSHAGFFAIKWVIQTCGYVRIDTHQDNKPMIHTLQKIGFHHCGTIILANGEPRIAFDYVSETSK